MEKGKVKICALIDSSDGGGMPVEKLAVITETYYERRTVGVTREYAAQGVRETIDALIRCRNLRSLPVNAEYAILGGEQYRINHKQAIEESHTGYDLTLERSDNEYELAETT